MDIEAGFFVLARVGSRRVVILECFQEKWLPVFRPEARQNKGLGSDFDSVKVDKTLCDRQLSL